MFLFHPPNPSFSEGYKVPPGKTQSHLKSQFPPEMTLARLSVQPKIKFIVYPCLKYMLQRVLKMTGVKLTIGRLLLIGIC